MTIKNGKNIELLYEPKDIIVEGDKGRISQVISILLNNALKFTTDGSVSIILEKNDSQVTVT